MVTCANQYTTAVGPILVTWIAQYARLYQPGACYWFASLDFIHGIREHVVCGTIDLHHVSRVAEMRFKPSDDKLVNMF